MDQILWEKCVAFHGHSCPGLAIGARAAEIALELLGVQAAGDEELVCITENDACGVDGVQVVTGCTVGKGNLLFRNTGKMAFSFYVRDTGKSVRLVPRDLPRLDREARRRFILEAPAEQVYQVKQTARPLPEKARLFRSVTCASCGESVAEDRARLRDGETLCLDCFDGYSRGW